jgi:hypothetical protein
MVSDSNKMEDAAYGSAFGEEPGLSWSHAQVKVLRIRAQISVWE